MNKLYIILPLLLTMLSSCISDPDGYLQRSGGGRLFSSSNIYTKKRLPAKNSKYIKRAKRNIEQQDFDDAEYDAYDSRAINRNFYMQMLAQEKKLQQRMRDTASERREFAEYQKQTRADSEIVRLSEESKKHQEQLKSEIESLRTVLDKAQDQIASIKCANRKKEDRGTSSDTRPIAKAKKLKVVSNKAGHSQLKKPKVSSRSTVPIVKNDKLKEVKKGTNAVNDHRLTKEKHEIEQPAHTKKHAEAVSQSSTPHSNNDHLQDEARKIEHDNEIEDINEIKASATSNTSLNKN